MYTYTTINLYSRTVYIGSILLQCDLIRSGFTSLTIGIFLSTACFLSVGHCVDAVPSFQAPTPVDDPRPSPSFRGGDLGGLLRGGTPVELKTEDRRSCDSLT